MVRRIKYLFTGNIYNLLDLNKDSQDWLESSFAKVCLIANDESQLLDIQNRASNAGLEVHLITDSGRTEFHGTPTHTSLAIGPAKVEEIDKITGNLTLY